MKVYDFINFQDVKDACQLTLEHKFLTLLLGGPGLGKTFSMHYLRKKIENTFLIDIRPQDKKAFVNPWKRLARQVLGDEIYDSKCKKLDFSDLTDYIVHGLNSRQASNLVFIDEAGSIGFPVLRNFRSMVDRTRSSTGYIISGPEYFNDNLKTWAEEEKIQGMNELQSRVDYKLTLVKPPFEDKEYACMQEGITDKVTIRKIAARSDNFRTLFREIYFHKHGIKSQFD
jgi:hypothetical protein